MKTDKVLRWGILGAARIAKSYTAAIRASRNGTLGAVAARDPVRAKAFADAEAIPRVAASYDALLEDPEVDAIYIALPNALHAEWAIRGLRAGKHVLCEKPLATSAAEAEKMADAARESGCHLAEAIMYRLHPVNTTAIGFLRQGMIGDLVSMNVTFFAPVGEDDPIRFSRELGGGALLDLGVYCLSLMLWAANENPSEVFGAMTPHSGGVDFWSAYCYWGQCAKIKY